MVLNAKCAWLGCSPDHKVYDLDAFNSAKNLFGLLEVKVVKEGKTTFNNVRDLVKDPVTSAYTLRTTDIYYYYQVQSLLGLTGLEWFHFLCYMNDNLYVCQRIMLDQAFFQETKDKVCSFFLPILFVLINIFIFSEYS